MCYLGHTSLEHMDPLLLEQEKYAGNSKSLNKHQVSGTDYVHSPTATDLDNQNSLTKEGWTDMQDIVGP